MKLMAAILTASFLMMTSVKAAPCDPNDAKCLTRAALEYKYKADALAQENELLRQELVEERNRAESAPKIFVIAMFVGAVFFGSFYTASKVWR